MNTTKALTILVGNLGKDVELCTTTPKTWTVRRSNSDLPANDAAARYLRERLGHDPFQVESDDYYRAASVTSGEKTYIKFSLAVPGPTTTWVQCRVWRADSLEHRNIRLHGTKGSEVKVAGRFRTDTFTDHATGRVVSFTYFEVRRYWTRRRRNYMVPEVDAPCRS